MKSMIVPLFVCFAIVASLSMTAAHGADISANLKTLKAVDREGNGNEAARAAWADLATADISELPRILDSLDDASPLAANWIRAAIDTIAERQLNSDGTLPVAALEQFVLDRSKGTRGRRLAFDLLVKVDPKAEDRLVPGFVDDPSLELRYDAVARLLTEGEALAKSPDDPAKKQQAIAVLHKALNGARDIPQIDAAAKALDQLGEKVSLVEHFGFLADWKIVGPFDNRGGIGFNTAYPPESTLDDPTREAATVYTGKDDRPARWIDYHSEDPRGMIDINKGIAQESGVVAYAAAPFFAKHETPVDIRVSCICACKVWLNGKLIASHEIYHSGSPLDQYISKGVLRPGRNSIVVKVCQNEQTEKWAQEWQFQLRVCDSIGTAIHSEP